MTTRHAYGAIIVNNDTQQWVLLSTCPYCGHRNISPELDSVYQLIVETIVAYKYTFASCFKCDSEYEVRLM